MAKESQMTRKNARYDAYNSSRRPDRRRGSPPPNNWGNRAEIHQDQPNRTIYKFLDDLHRRYGGDDLRQLFREHAGQSDELGEAIGIWLLFDDVSTLLTSSSWLPSSCRLTRGWLIGNTRCASVANQNLPTVPMLKNLTLQMNHNSSRSTILRPATISKICSRATTGHTLYRMSLRTWISRIRIHRVPNFVPGAVRGLPLLYLCRAPECAWLTLRGGTPKDGTVANCALPPFRRCHPNSNTHPPRIQAFRIHGRYPASDRRRHHGAALKWSK